jgi:hypothetical protein
MVCQLEERMLRKISGLEFNLQTETKMPRSKYVKMDVEEMCHED